MRRSTLFAFWVCALLIAVNFSAHAQDDRDIIDDFMTTGYTLGDKFFSVHLGGIFPIANYSPHDKTFTSTNLSFSGSGYLEFSAFLNDRISLGGAIGASVPRSLTGDSLLLVPLTVSGTWVFQVFPFDIPIFLRSGLNFTKRGSELFVGPIAQTGSGIYWNMDSSWSFGIRGTYTWLPVFTADSSRSHMNRFGNYFELHLGVIHHF